MEDERSFSGICGGRLALQRRYYSPSCREFCLSCPGLSLHSLTAVTCTVWLAHDPLCCHLHHPLRSAWLSPFCED
uniref:Uncharacterized protein n=1 Tax=Pan paniscus TaxID=9597 RepID=A0A2R9BA31_PANPA